MGAGIATTIRNVGASYHAEYRSRSIAESYSAAHQSTEKGNIDGGLVEPRGRSLAAGGEDFLQLLRRDCFELGVGAVGGFLVGTPAAEVGEVAEPGSLHVLVGDLND
jgi:hypothetical protein